MMNINQEELRVDLKPIKEAKELAICSANVFTTIRQKLKDGLQPKDILSTITERMNGLIIAFDGYEKAPKEVKNNPCTTGQLSLEVGKEIFGVN